MIMIANKQTGIGYTRQDLCGKWGSGLYIILVDFNIITQQVVIVNPFLIYMLYKK